MARVSGAQFWSGLGIETRKIAILARWASGTIYRYVAEAPLGMITVDVKTLLSNSLGMESRGAGHTELVNRLNSLEAKIVLLVDVASAGDSCASSGVLVPATVVDGPASGDTSCRTFIVNDRTRSTNFGSTT